MHTKRISVLLALGALLTTSVLHAQQTPVTLRVVGFKAGSELGNIPKINELFMQENPGLKVEYETIPNDTYNAVMNSRLAAGDTTDVLFGRARENMLNWSKANLITDLSDQPWKNNLVSSAAAIARVGNKTYQFPTQVVGLGLLYNKTMLDSVGAKVPQTYTEFLLACDKLKKAGKLPLLIGMKDSWGGLLFSTLVAANTVYVQDPDFDAKVIAGSAKFSGPAWTSVLRVYDDLTRRGFFDPKINLGVGGADQALNEFTAGRVAFVPHGSWSVSGIKQNNPSLQFGFAPFPGGRAGSKPRGIDLTGVTLMINAKSKAQDAAKKYIAFWAQDRVLKMYLEKEGAFSTLKGGTTSLPSEMSSFVQAVSDERTVSFPFQVWPNSGFQDIYMKGLKDYVSGTATAAAVLSDWDRQFQPR